MVARIRPADAAVVHAVTRVQEVARRAYYEAGGITASAEDNPSASIECLDFRRTMITAEDNHAWVAEDSTHCVAFLIAGPPVRKDMPVGVRELVALYVLPEAWGSGVADDLHQRFVEMLGSAPPTTGGVLDVWSGNRRARAFYRRHGWEADGRSRPGPGSQPFLGLRLAIPA